MSPNSGKNNQMPSPPAGETSITSTEPMTLITNADAGDEGALTLSPDKANAVVDPSSRHKSIIDVPNEILIEILSYFDFETHIYSPSGYDPKSPHIDAIKNLRLTCRKLSLIASEFLLDFVHVEPSEESLHRLECIANHPMIGQKIRGAHVSFAMYHPRLARKLDPFIKSMAIQFWFEWYHEEGHHYDGLYVSQRFFGSGSEKKRLKYRAKAIKKSWGGGDAGTDYICKPIAGYLHAAFREYKRRFNEQQQLLGGLFTQRVATSLSHMPKLKCLMINDIPTLPHLGKGNVWQTLRNGTRAEVVQRYMKPFDYLAFEDFGGGMTFNFPIKKAFDLLTKLPQAGVGVRDLRCRFPFKLDEVFNIDCSPMYDHLGRLGSQITNADMSLPACLDPNEDLVIEPWFQEFFTALLRDAPLASLRLSTEAMGIYERSPVFNSPVTSPLLHAHRHGKLHYLVLEGASISINALKGFMELYKATEVDSRKPKLHLELSKVYLQRPDTWLEVLDLLRGCVDDTSIIRSPEGEMADGVSDVLVSWLKYHTFELSDTPGGEDSKAVEYIRGAAVPNPIAEYLANNA
ncbi:hypothetical protein F5Y16DRAFT_401435 [Xylariaceae sp. FL0255]|nr:hypothetical protein F5Y16DRAFT_401435 [Xylariaceae sp. FL0255]